MSKIISIRDDLYEKLKGDTKTGGLSSSEKIDNLISDSTGFEEAIINPEGRIVPKDVNMSSLKGKTILYKVKE